VHSLSGDAGAGGVELFILATREDDARFSDVLVKHLAPLRRRGVRTFNPYRQMAGCHVHRHALDALERSQIVVLLVSHHLLAASGDVEEWVDLAMAAQRAGRIVVPVIVGACAWQKEPTYGRLTVLPRGKENKPVDMWAHQDQAWVSIVEDLEEMIREKFGDLLQG
jgi:TIR domain-containing protein